MTTTSYTNHGRYVFTVPDQCTSVTITAKGAGGGNGESFGGTIGQGAAGGLVTATYAVTPGDTLYVRVGGAGSNGIAAGRAGGYNGGGDGGSSPAGGGSAGGGAGGGASDVRLGTEALVDRMIVAAGGGGGGAADTTVAGGAAGAGGAGTGAAGGAGGGGQNGTGGGGGTPSAGGAAGSPGGLASDDAQAGSLGNGGNGSHHTSLGYVAGGGGGGGLQGGGGGGGAGGSGVGGAGGGGGGSNYVGAGTSATTTRGAGAAAGANGSVTLTYNVAPNQPALLSPVGNQNVDLTAAIRAGWQFSDPDPGDTQSKADLRWRVGAGAWTTITSASADATAHYDFPANTFASYAGQSIEWQARAYDADNAVSRWSASGFFVPINPPTTPSFDPTPVIDSNTPEVNFDMPDGAITHQVQLWSDSGGSPGAALIVGGVPSPTSAVTSFSTTLPYYAYVNGTAYHVLARYQHVAGVWSAFGDSGPVVADISAPLQPVATLTGLDDTASVRIDIANPGSDPFPPTHNDVYRLDVRTGIEVRIATGVALDGNYTDWTPGLNRPYRYRVVAVTSTGAFTSSV